MVKLLPHISESRHSIARFMSQKERHYFLTSQLLMVCTFNVVSYYLEQNM